jgi:hypothetical protein
VEQEPPKILPKLTEELHASTDHSVLYTCASKDNPKIGHGFLEKWHYGATYAGKIAVYGLSRNI